MSVITAVAWFQLFVGVGMIGLWIALVLTRQVPQIPAGNRDIWFHLAAELLTAVLLVAGGITLQVSGSDAARTISGFALGALLYTTLNSPGDYADRSEWPAVVMFAVLTLSTIAVGIVLMVAG